MIESKEWRLLARRILRAQLDRERKSYADLAEALVKEIGIERKTPKALSNLITRGSFSFEFFLQCMYILEIDVVRLWDRKPANAPATGIRLPPQAAGQVRPMEREKE